MIGKVGRKFSGVVTSVRSFGVFVELTELLVEGMVHITALPKDYYHFDPMNQILTGERSSRRYCAGDVLEVEVLQVMLDERKIELGVVETKTEKKPGKRRRR